MEILDRCFFPQEFLFELLYTPAISYSCPISVAFFSARKLLDIRPKIQYSSPKVSYRAFRFLAAGLSIKVKFVRFELYLPCVIRERKNLFLLSLILSLLLFLFSSSISKRASKHPKNSTLKNRQNFSTKNE